MTSPDTIGMNPAVFAAGVEDLTRRDPLIRSLHERNGDPPRWARPATFATMVLFVLEQQVSLASAKAAYVRLHERLGRVTPQGLLALTDEEMRAVGFSRQKASYCRGIAELLLAGELDLASLGSLDDEAARGVLTAVRGIGRWTANVYLLFVLGRPDAWPTGDRALYVAMAAAFGLDEVPDPAEADNMAEEWAPYRGVAAFFLWHNYLGGRAYQDDDPVADILG